VDDEPTIRGLVGEMLAGEGVDLVCAADGAQALREARTTRPDLILLDVVLPDLDGVSVLRLLRADPAMQGVQVHMLTARIRAEDRRRAFAAGADGYIEKPFKAEALQAVVRHARAAVLS
jgi:DNA-binding response OmpR family regulator